VKATSGTTGLPFALVRRNMAKIAGVMGNVSDILAGLMRGLPLDVLDTGVSTAGGSAVSFTARGSSLGVVLPSNSPGVHSLWAPAIALKTPLLLKPGSAEPFTPLRIVQAFIAAGVPKQAFAYLPSSHAGASEILTPVRPRDGVRRHRIHREVAHRFAHRSPRPRATAKWSSAPTRVPTSRSTSTPSWPPSPRTRADPA
jgi:hypothetical protein